MNKIRKKLTNTSIPTLNYDNKIYESNAEKTNLFANILKSTFSDNNDIVFDAKFKTETENKFNKAYQSCKIQNPSDLFTWEEFKDEVKKLKNHSSPGKDIIHNLLIKNSSDNFQHLILHLINISIDKICIPISWKESLITLIPKKKKS